MTLAAAKSHAPHAFYLDETSGNRADAVGSSVLVDGNTVTSQAGKFGTAAEFTRANSESLDTSGESYRRADQDYSVTCWVKLKTVPGTSEHYTLAGVFGGTGWELYTSTSGADVKKWAWYQDGDGNVGECVSTQTPEATSWHLLVAYHSATNNEIGFSVDGETYVTVSLGAGNSSTTASDLHLGQLFTANYANALIDDFVYLEDYNLSQAEVTELWNGGAGVKFADWSIGPSYGGGFPIRRTYRPRPYAPGFGR